MANLLLFNGFDFKRVECNGLSDYYRYLNSECFDIAVRKVGGTYYDIFVDDIGLFREEPVITAISNSGEPMLVGNLIFANHDTCGNTTSLSENDILSIMDSTGFAVVKKPTGKEVVKVVICDY